MGIDEKVIDGVLNYLDSADNQWHPYSAKQLTKMLKEILNSEKGNG